MAPALLTAVDAASHIHLIVGSNPLAGARCARAIEVGAKPILIAPEDSTLHYGLVKRIEAGEVKWLQRSFLEGDLTTLGRPEVDGVVDAVYVTAGGKQTSGASTRTCQKTPPLIRHSYPDLESLPKTTDTRQCRRRTEPLLLHSPIHPFRRPSTNRRHNLRQGL
jgi:hypothetical protein